MNWVTVAKILKRTVLCQVWNDEPTSYDEQQSAVTVCHQNFSDPICLTWMADPNHCCLWSFANTPLYLWKQKPRWYKESMLNINVVWLEVRCLMTVMNCCKVVCSWCDMHMLSWPQTASTLSSVQPAGFRGGPHGSVMVSLRWLREQSVSICRSVK